VVLGKWSRENEQISIVHVKLL